MRLTLDEVFRLSKYALTACGASEAVATSMAHSIREAEAEGMRNIGLGFLPFYCNHLRTGAIVGDADPRVADRGPAVVLVDGRDGFAHHREALNAPPRSAAEFDLHRGFGDFASGRNRGAQTWSVRQLG